MKKQTKKNSQPSADEVFNLFDSSPERAYEYLINSGMYYSEDFWKFFTQPVLEKLYNLHPHSKKVLDKIVFLKRFYDLDVFYKKYNEEYQTELISLNPSPEALTKALFLCLELGEENARKDIFPVYSIESLWAIKKILKAVYPKLKQKGQSAYSAELTQLCNNIIKTQQDIILLADFADALVWAGFEMKAKENNQGLLLYPLDKNDNLFVLNELKTQIKREFRKKQSQTEVSNSEHFKINDPIQRTNEGFAIGLHTSNLEVTSTSPGIISLQVEDSFFDGIKSDNIDNQQAAGAKSITTLLEQHFHYNYRQALAEIYQPNDELDIKAFSIQIEDEIVVSLYDIICAMSCLIAKADGFRSLGEISGQNILTYKRRARAIIKQKHPELKQEELDKEIDGFIVTSLLELEKKHGFFNFVTIENLFNLFRSIEELKAKTDEELYAIVKLFSDVDSTLPFNPLYKIDDRYYFSYQTCCNFNLNRILYDYYITDKLFSQKNNENKKTSEYNKDRAKQFSIAIKALLLKHTNYVEADIEYRQEVGDEKKLLHGESDVIAYFEDENIVLAIEIKLNNTSPKSEKRKKVWVRDQIGKGLKQVEKDKLLLKDEESLVFIAEKLNVKHAIINPVVVSIIVADNFIADHQSFTYNNKKDNVLCVSYFELKQLLLNEAVHENQPSSFFKDEKFMASQLIKAIEENIFWSFLNEKVQGYSFTKKLTAINEEFRIELKI